MIFQWIIAAGTLFLILITVGTVMAWVSARNRAQCDQDEEITVEISASTPTEQGPEKPE